MSFCSLIVCTHLLNWAANEHNHANVPRVPLTVYANGFMLWNLSVLNMAPSGQCLLLYQHWKQFVICDSLCWGRPTTAVFVCCVSQLLSSFYSLPLEWFRNGKLRQTLVWKCMQIGRAHVWTPVTQWSRMPSSAWKKKKKTHNTK